MAPEFARPEWLLLLVLLPALPWFARARDAGAARVRRITGTALRALVLGALIVALAGPLKGSHPRHTDLMFALDVSGSVDPETRARALDFVNQAFRSKAPEARAGLVVFGADAATEVFLGPRSEPLRDLSVEVPAEGTDIGRALEVAMGAFASEGRRRVVLLSDGRGNLGNARAASAVARSLGIEILALPLESPRTLDEVHVREVVAPPVVRAGAPFEVAVAIESRSRARAHLVLLRDGVVLRDESVALRPGSNTFSLVEQAPEAGLHEYEAVVNSDRDRTLENNRHHAFVRVRGAPEVLYVRGREDPGPPLAGALEAQGLRIEEIPAVALPAALHELVEYDLVVLDDVSGFDLSLEKMEQLERYVRDAGGGLVKVGGDRSYSAGGYYDTPVEGLLPVTMDVETEVRIPSLAVTFVIDKSGSMSSRAGGEEKLAIAKVAALSAIEVLNPLDRVAVLSFDADHEWSVPVTEAGNRQAIAETLRVLGAGGSTDLFQALEEAHRGMREQSAKLKHLIVLSDGLSNSEADYEGLARRIYADGITISTVSFGHDADLALMAGIAAKGQGRYYHTPDPRGIPRIFASETLVISRDLLVEEPVQPRPAYPGEMLVGFEGDAFPPLAGYQRTYPKAAAQVLLEAGDRDPLLAAWRYGLGKAVAFTSDLGGRWGGAWVEWAHFGRFAAQMARWTMRHRGPETLLPAFSWRGRRAEISVDALDADERFVNHLDMRATVVDPKGASRVVALEQVAPGRYRGEFDALPAGRYYVHLLGRSEEGQVGPETFGMALPYSSEYLDLGADHEGLREIAAATGGRVLPLSNASLAAVHASSAGRPGPRWRVWRPLLLAALLLLLLEVAVRKIALPEAWSRRRDPRRSRPGTGEEADLEALGAAIAEARERHLEALRREPRARPGDPAARARLYASGLGRSAG